MSPVLSEEFLSACKDSVGDTFMFRFLIDTRKRMVIAVPPDGTHLGTAVSYLGLEERELTQESAGHLIGGTVVVKKGVYVTRISHTSFSTTRNIQYSRKIEEESKKIMTDFFERSRTPVNYEIRAAI